MPPPSQPAGCNLDGRNCERSLNNLRQHQTTSLWLAARRGRLTLGCRTHSARSGRQAKAAHFCVGTPARLARDRGHQASQTTAAAICIADMVVASAVKTAMTHWCQSIASFDQRLRPELLPLIRAQLIHRLSAPKDDALYTHTVDPSPAFARPTVLLKPS